uniref:MAGE domain-containing protein n=1 Tax=Ditylenchus dipsaci TaxID=166011 RepID=A0A915DB12_9BILA
MPSSNVPFRRPRDQSRNRDQTQPSTSKAASKSNRTRNRVDSSSSNESTMADETTETQNTLTQIDRRELTKDAAQFIMASASVKGFVREADLKKLFETRNKEARDTDITATSQNLKEVFGYELHFDPKGCRYFVCSDLTLPTSDVIDKIVGQRSDVNNTVSQKEKVNSNKEGVLISALMFIFMVKRHLHEVIDKENGIGINMLKEFLNLVGVVEDDVFAAWFGPSRTAEFLSQGWIECLMKRDAAVKRNILQLGSRAETVVDKKQMLESFCRIYGSKVEEWSRHAAISGIKGVQTL